MKADIKRWWEQALEDLATAEANLISKRYYAAVLFCQQAIEKALKAWWIKEKNNEPPYTHDLTLLSKNLNLSLKFFSACKELTTAYTETRYPDSGNVIPSKKFSKNDAIRYIDNSKEIIKWIQERIS